MNTIMEVWWNLIICGSGASIMFVAVILFDFWKDGVKGKGFVK